jgi:hypothetical protein
MRNIIMNALSPEPGIQSASAPIPERIEMILGLVLEAWQCQFIGGLLLSLLTAADADPTSIFILNG